MTRQLIDSKHLLVFPIVIRFRLGNNEVHFSGGFPQEPALGRTGRIGCFLQNRGTRLMGRVKPQSHAARDAHYRAGTVFGERDNPMLIRVRSLILPLDDRMLPARAIAVQSLERERVDQLVSTIPQIPELPCLGLGLIVGNPEIHTCLAAYAPLIVKNQSP